MEDVKLGKVGGDSFLEYKQNGGKGSGKVFAALSADGYGALIDQDEEEDQRVQSKLETANFLSSCLFTWLNPVLTHGYKNGIEADDLPPVPKEDGSELLADRFEALLQEEKLRGVSHLRGAMWKFFGKDFVLNSFWSPIGFLGAVAQVLLLRQVIIYVSDTESGKTEESVWGWTVSSNIYGILLCLGMGLGAIFQVFANHYVMFVEGRLGVRARGALSTCVYRKILRAHSSVVRTTGIGYLTNLVTQETRRIESSFQYAFQLMWFPLYILACIALLIIQVGVPALTGLGILILLMPIQVRLGSKIGKIRTATALSSNDRMRSLSELLLGIRVVKLFAWEPSFYRQVTAERDVEYGWLKKSSIIKAINDGLFFGASTIMIVTVFTLYVYLQGELKADTAFTCIALFNLIGRYLLGVPRSATYFVEGSGALTRIGSFLLEEETDHRWNRDGSSGYISLPKSRSFSSQHHPIPSVSFSAALVGSGIPRVTSLLTDDPICLVNASFTWDQFQPPVLEDINFSLPQGSLLAVVGKVGAGKSSLLAAILGELRKTRGAVSVRGSIAYVPQQAWILNQSIRDNILMGAPYDEAKYLKVLKACALEDDLKLFAAGDRTEIGEKGINLSGGQKQRISLARACYGDSEIILLDDPLSAVDANVGQHLFNECICGLMRNKTRVLVLHQLHFLARAEVWKILMLDEGKVEQFGTYDFLISSGTRELEEEKKETKSEKKTEKDGDARLTTKEDKAEGHVSWAVYKRYIQAGGGPLVWLFVFSMFCLSQAFSIASTYWVAWWTDDRFDKNPTNLQRSELYVYGLILLSGLMCIFGFLRSLTLFFCTLSASSNIHNDAFVKLLTAPLAYFDVTPIGRITTRFGHDLDQLDQELPWNLLNLLAYSISVLGALLTIVVVTPWFGVAFIPIGIVFWYYQQYSQQTSQQLKRLNGITRSPINSHLASTLLGLDSVRAYRQQGRFQRLFTEYSDRNNSSSLLFLAIGRWLGLRLDILSTFVIVLTTALVVTFKDTIGPGLAGVAISQSILMAGSFQWAVRQGAEFENSMTSTERMIALESIPTEGNQAVEAKEGSRLTKNGWEFGARWGSWPTTGSIKFENVWMSYRPGLESVLRGISFEIKHGNRVGIVGRTGAGKSSLLHALFRLSEISDGRILIGGQDTGLMPLHVLRSRMSIIPQDPVLFQGTIRRNLDPLQQYSDNELWDVIRRVHLEENVQRLSGLDYNVEETGGNLSVGERQLLCLGRALLRQSKVIVMDEATANVDMATDSMIQLTIRREFRDATVLTIAHRINTIIDSDVILVMSEGKVAEFGPPKSLLESPGSIFAELWRLQAAAEAAPSSSSSSSSSPSAY